MALLTGGVVAGGVFVYDSAKPSSQPLKPVSTHVAAPRVAAPATKPPQPAPAQSMPTPSVVHSSPATLPVMHTAVVTAAQANVSTAAATHPVAPIPAPTPTPTPTPSPTPTPTPAPAQPFNPDTDILPVPLGGDSASIELSSADGSSQYWSPGSEAFSWNDSTPPTEKPLAPEYLVMEYPETTGPYYSPTMTFHIHSTAASTVGYQGQTWIQIGDWTKGPTVFMNINYEIVAQ